MSRKLGTVDLKAHDLALVYPKMKQDEFDDLVKDIGKNGLLEPLTLYEGKILDGVNRNNACKRLRVVPEVIPFHGSDPITFVRSKNQSRRHLSASQRAAIELKLNELWRERGRVGEGMTEKEMASSAGVSERTIRLAKKAERDGMGDSVRAGDISVFGDVREVIEKKDLPPVRSSYQHETDRHKTLVEEMRNQIKELEERDVEKSRQINHLTDIVQSYQEGLGIEDKERVVVISNLRIEIRSLKISRDGLAERNLQLSNLLKKREQELEQLRHGRTA